MISGRTMAQRASGYSEFKSSILYGSVENTKCLRSIMLLFEKVKDSAKNRHQIELTNYSTALSANNLKSWRINL